MKTKKLIKAIEEHKELHDLITHLGDFDYACRKMADITEDAGDRLYWKRQASVTAKLIRIVNQK